MDHLIIIHGAIGAADQMEPLSKMLNEHFNVHPLELAGHGRKSSEEGFPFSMDHFVDQLNQFIAGLNSDKVHVFGYSMGGFIALLSATANQSIASVFTLGTKLKWDPEIAGREIKMLNPDKIEAKIPAFAQALAQRHGDILWKELLDKTAKLMIDLGDQQPINKESMSLISCPVHLCLADQDEMVTIEETLETAALIKNVTHSRLSQSRHPIEKVNLEELVQKIVDFSR